MTRTSHPRVALTFPSPSAVRRPGDRLLAAAVCLGVLVPSLLVVLAGTRYLTPTGWASPDSPAASLARNALLGLLVVILLWRIIVAPADTSRPPHTLLVGIAPIVAVVSSLASGGDVVPTIIAFVTVVSFWVRPPGVELIRQIAGWGVVSCVISLILGATLPAYGLMPSVSGDQSDKAIVGGTLLSGMFNHSNTLGAVAVLILPLVFLFRRRSTVIFSVAVTLAALLWSASRTSIIAAIAMALAWVAVLLLRRSNRLAVSVVSLAVITASFLVALVPFVTEDPTAFTSRGQIWIFARGAFEASPIFGNGVSFFQDIWAVNNGLFKDAQHAHNSLLTQLTTLGVVGGLGLVLLMLSCVLISLAYARAGRFQLSMYIIVWLVLSIGETVWRFSVTQPMWLFGTLPLIILAASGVPRRNSPQPRHGQRGHMSAGPSTVQGNTSLVQSDLVPDL